MLENRLAVSEYKENVFLIDWLTVTVHDTSVFELQMMLGLNPAEHTWTEKRVFQDGYPMQSFFNNITIRWGADRAEFYQDDDKKLAKDKVRVDMGISLNMSGQGCRAFEEYGTGDWFSLLNQLCSMDRKVNFTRLDLAYDDHIGIIDIYRVRTDVEERNYISRAKQAFVIWSDDQEKDLHGLTVSVGSKKSPVLIRIYDKAAERGFDSSVHWIRVELQLRAERALVAVASIIQREDIGKVASGVLRNYLTFREPSNDTNKSRWPLADYWQRVLSTMEKISLWICPGEPYNFSKTEYHMVEQYGQQFLTSCKIFGGPEHFWSACSRRHTELKPKYNAAIEEAAAERARYLAKRQEVRKYYGFQEVPFDDPDYQTNIADMFIDELLPGFDFGIYCLA